MPDWNKFKKILWLVLGVWFICFLVAISPFSSLPSKGQFGDVFGSINALFSGLAFAGLIYTVMLQKNAIEMQQSQLSMQRDELALQREEMKASRAELANQVKMQHALIRATIAQISVAGINADIEADKLEAQASISISAGIPENPCRKIRAASGALRGLADKLEKEMPSIG